MRSIRLGLAAACLLVVPLPAQAQNNTPATALRIAPNTSLAMYTDDATNMQRWFQFGVAAHRSYCVETAPGEFVAGEVDPLNDSVLDLYSDAGTTLIIENDDNAVEPTHQGGGATAGLSRVCDIVTAPGTRFVKLSHHDTGIEYWKVKFSDTTLFAPWFFSGGGYEAFVLIKNTTGTPTDIRGTLYSPTGAFLGDFTGVAPPNGSFNVQISLVLPPGTQQAGSVSIAHGAAPGGIVASVTSLNFGAGVSFDVTASPRQDWRQ